MLYSWNLFAKFLCIKRNIEKLINKHIIDDRGVNRIYLNDIPSNRTTCISIFLKILLKNFIHFIPISENLLSSVII